MEVGCKTVTAKIYNLKLQLRNLPNFISGHNAVHLKNKVNI